MLLTIMFLTVAWLLIAGWLDKPSRPDCAATRRHEEFAAKRRRQAKWNWKTRSYDR